MLTRYQELFNNLTRSEAYSKKGGYDKEKINKNKFTPHSLKALLIGDAFAVGIYYTTGGSIDKTVMEYRGICPIDFGCALRYRKRKTEGSTKYGTHHPNGLCHPPFPHGHRLHRPPGAGHRHPDGLHPLGPAADAQPRKRGLPLELRDPVLRGGILEGRIGAGEGGAVRPGRAGHRHCLFAGLCDGRCREPGLFGAAGTGGLFPGALAAGALPPG